MRFIIFWRAAIQIKNLMKPQLESGFDKSQNFRANDISPFLVEFFMVRGAGFRCMAYQDGEGRWRRAFDNAELAGRISVFEEPAS
jgi:hypothetical protein